MLMIGTHNSTARVEPISCLGHRPEWNLLTSARFLCLVLHCPLMISRCTTHTMSKLQNFRKYKVLFCEYDLTCRSLWQWFVCNKCVKFRKASSEKWVSELRGRSETMQKWGTRQWAPSRTSRFANNCNEDGLTTVAQRQQFLTALRCCHSLVSVH
jgi:hypothetical protein